MINEVLFLPHPTSSDFSECRKWIDIYHKSGLHILSGCTLENDHGSPRVDFGDAFKSVDTTYFSVRHKLTLNQKFVLWKFNHILCVHDLLLNKIDGIGLLCGGELIDALCCLGQ